MGRPKDPKCLRRNPQIYRLEIQPIVHHLELREGILSQLGAANSHSGRVSRQAQTWNLSMTNRVIPRDGEYVS